MVFQLFNLFPHLTAAENVMLGLRKVRGLAKAEARERAQRWLARVGLADKVDSLPAQLSGGQQQRVGIARAVAMDPKVLLLDEITSALDPELVGEVLAVVQDLAKDGMTMLVVTHEMSFARELSDRVVFIDGGEILVSGTPREVFFEQGHERLRAFLSRLDSAHAFGEHLMTAKRDDIRLELGLRPVINASGTMTFLGASIVVPEAIEAMARVLPQFVEIGDLQRKASAAIARLTGAEAGTVTASTASGITRRDRRLHDRRRPRPDRAAAGRLRHEARGAPAARPHGQLRRAGRAGGAACRRDGAAVRRRHRRKAVPASRHAVGPDRGGALRGVAPLRRLRPDPARAVLRDLPRARRAGDRRCRLGIRSYAASSPRAPTS